MKNLVNIILFISFLILPYCSPKNKIAGDYSFKTECLGVEMDGSQTVKAWGKGKNRSDAIEHAMKVAVRDVLFNGIYSGSQECEKRPVLPEVNVQMKNEAYFNNFFSDGGDYEKYVSTKDGGVTGKNAPVRKDATSGVTYGVVIRVLRSELRQKMIDDGILKL
jgi:hypothetical protein